MLLCTGAKLFLSIMERLPRPPDKVSSDSAWYGPWRRTDLQCSSWIPLYPFIRWCRPIFLTGDHIFEPANTKYLRQAQSWASKSSIEKLFLYSSMIWASHKACGINDRSFDTLWILNINLWIQKISIRMLYFS